MLNRKEVWTEESGYVTGSLGCINPRPSWLTIPRAPLGYMHNAYGYPHHSGTVTRRVPSSIQAAVSSTTAASSSQKPSFSGFMERPNNFQSLETLGAASIRGCEEINGKYAQIRLS
jgi:hypothetical protein